MKLSLVLDQLRSGDLSELSNVRLTDQRIISYINLALITFYNRYPLRTEEAIVAIETGKTVYKLDGTDPSVTVNGNPIDIDDVIIITQAFDEFGEIPINDENDPASIFTITYDTIQVPVAQTGMFLSLIYKAGPKAFVTFTDSGDGSAVDVNVPLPLALLEALLMFIAYRAFLSTGDAGTPSADKYEMKFKDACNKAETIGTVPSDSFAINIEKRGWA